MGQFPRPSCSLLDRSLRSLFGLQNLVRNARDAASVHDASRVYRLTGVAENYALDPLRAAWLQLGGEAFWHERASIAATIRDLFTEGEGLSAVRQVVSDALELGLVTDRSLRNYADFPPGLLRDGVVT